MTIAVTTGRSDRRLSVPPLVRWLAGRLLMVIPLLVVVSIITFSLTEIVPGDPAVTMAGDNATEESIERIRGELGLDRPVVIRYLEWTGAAITGDLGVSLRSPVPVTTLLEQRLPVTLSLTGLAISIAVIAGGALGLLAAVFRGRWPDRLVTGLASIGVAVPSFWLGMMLVIAFSIKNPWFPSIGYTPFGESPTDWLHHLWLPALTLAAAPTAEIARQLRASLVHVLEQDYVRTARANGLRGRSVVLKHALKNAAISVVTIIGLQIAFLLGGSVIVEAVFGLPGLGSLVVVSVLQRDLPVIQGVVLLTAVLVLLVNVAVDATYGILNPKVRT